MIVLVQPSFHTTWTSLFEMELEPNSLDWNGNELEHELIVNWFLNLLVCNLIEREMEREKVQMKPPLVSLILAPFQIG